MNSAMPRLRGPVKLAYGFGLAAEGIKQNAFSIFLLFYYQQIVRLDPALCGLALFFSLCVDAIADPAIGMWSDNLRTKLGRRHPLMYAGIAPLALSFYAVFTPPLGMGTVLTFTWLFFFASAARFAMALFVIPHQSLVPELTHDVGERTTLTSLRTTCAWIFGLVNAFMAYRVFLGATPEYPQGLLNPAGYPKLALFGSAVMVVAMTVSALGTQRAALRVAPREPAGKHSLRELPSAVRRALQSHSYRTSLCAGLALFVGFGLSENMGNYMNTFFWGFTSEQLGVFIFVILGASLVVMALARRLVERYGMRRLGMASAALMTTPMPAMVALRLLGMLPPSGSGALLPLLAVAAFFSYAGLIMGMTVIGTMIADVTDEHALLTGKREEGLLFSANMFMTKAASGLGTLAAGLLIRVARFPQGSTESIAPELVRNLGLVSLAGSLGFGALMIYFFSQYRLDRTKHQQIVATLRLVEQEQAP